MEKRRRTITSDLIESLTSMGCKIYRDEYLSKHTSFRIGGAAKFFIEIPNYEALGLFLKAAEKQKIRFFILGGGTNVLFADKGFDGAVIKLSGDFEKIEIQGNEVSCGAAVSLPFLVKSAADKNLSGLEFAAGIPGSAGGAVFGNAGTGDEWIGSAVQSVEIFKNAKKELINKEKIDFYYRKSGLEGRIVTKINFVLKKETEKNILKEISESIEKRKKSQPLNRPNAGCIFKNPVGLSAGKLIDDAGLKGKKKGGAEISEVHANFIVNNGNAKSSDILDLIYTARKSVKEKFNIDLELEIKIV